MEMSKHKPFFVWIGLGFLMAGIVALSLGSLYPTRCRRLVRNGMAARRLVTAYPDPLNRGVSSSLSTAGLRTSATQAFSYAAEAVPITVFYLPYDAAVDCPDDARDWLRNESRRRPVASRRFSTSILALPWILGRSSLLGKLWTTFHDLVSTVT